MFNKKSVVVQAWVRQIKNPEGSVTFDDVPALSNLRDVVGSILENIKSEVDKNV